MKTSLILKGTADQFGRLPVYIRHSDGQKRTFKKTEVKLTKEQFLRFKSRTHLPKERELYARFLDCLSPKKEQKKAPPFFAYCQALAKEWEQERAAETMRYILSEMSKLKKFQDGFTLADVTPDFLKEYKDYCKGLGNTNNTLWKTFKFLRTVMRRAVKEKLVPENPFDIFEMPKYKDPERQWLTEEQVKQIDSVSNLPKEIQFVRDWFLISCYTGLRFGDMVAFDKKKHIRNGRLVLYTSKTGEVVSLPFTDRIRALFERVEYRPVPYTNVHFNRLLKQVDIGEHLHAHKARHSFAMLCASRKISQEVTAKLLGHTNLKTTAIYYRITGDRIDDEFQKLD